MAFIRCVPSWWAVVLAGMFLGLWCGRNLERLAVFVRAVSPTSIAGAVRAVIARWPGIPPAAVPVIQYLLVLTPGALERAWHQAEGLANIVKDAHWM